MSIGYLLVNFGGPRDLEEVAPFLRELLTDRDVIRTRLPSFLNRLLFTRIAKKRAKKVVEDYEAIGGKSPIFEDTEYLAQELSLLLKAPVLPFHRYLTATHPAFLSQIQSTDWERIRIFPLFPQFTYATTGSIARWFEAELPKKIVSRMRWTKSYPAHPAFIGAYAERIEETLRLHTLKEEECCFIFSAHGIPKAYVEAGDLYEEECRLTYEALKQRFPKALSLLSYQSQFGKEEWLKPYTKELVETLECDRKAVLVVPIAFTSDHIETLFEIEEEHLPPLRRRGYAAFRVPSLNRNRDWIEGIARILQDNETLNNPMLVRRND